MNVWDEVRIKSTGIKAIVTSLILFPSGSQAICKWKQDGELHMMTLDVNDLDDLVTDHGRENA